jgi:hypothetical protein
MRRRDLFILLVFFLFLPLQGVVAAEQGEEAETVQERLDRLQQELNQLRREHEAEIKDLEEKLERQENRSAREGAPHRSQPVGSWGIMNPSISAIADVQALFTNNKENDNRNKVRVKEVEFAFQGYLYPGIRADVIPALEMEYIGDEVNVEIDLEEAYLTMSPIPLVGEYVPLGLQLGRKFMNFGILNPIHPHHWPFADTPLVLESFFGSHNWYDDGLQGFVNIPNPWDLYLKTTFGYWNGRQLGHAHGHDEGDHAHEDEGHAHSVGEPVQWDGRVYLSRTILGVPFGRTSDVRLGASVSWDEGRSTTLVGGDLTYTYRFPGTYHRLRWQNEFMAADIGTGDYWRYGGYSLLAFSLGRYWETGARYDQSQILDPFVSDDQWASTGFITYFLTHSLYFRGQYRYRNTLEDEDEHNGYIQMVFGLGPHAHRLEN